MYDIFMATSDNIFATSCMSTEATLQATSMNNSKKEDRIEQDFEVITGNHAAELAYSKICLILPESQCSKKYVPIVATVNIKRFSRTNTDIAE